MDRASRLRISHASFLLLYSVSRARKETRRRDEASPTSAGSINDWWLETIRTGPSGTPWPPRVRRLKRVPNVQKQAR